MAQGGVEKAVKYRKVQGDFGHRLWVAVEEISGHLRHNAVLPQEEIETRTNILLRQ